MSTDYITNATVVNILKLEVEFYMANTLSHRRVESEMAQRCYYEVSALLECCSTNRIGESELFVKLLARCGINGIFSGVCYCLTRCTIMCFTSCPGNCDI